jgi:hypothetical protein
VGGGQPDGGKAPELRRVELVARGVAERRNGAADEVERGDLAQFPGRDALDADDFGALLELVGAVDPGGGERFARR